MLQLAEAVNKFNEDSSGSKKLLEKAEKKFDNKVLEHIAQHIAINQAKLSSVLTEIESSYSNIASLFAKLCNVAEFTKEVKDKINKIDEDLKDSV